MDKVLKYLPWAILVIICLLFLNYCSDSHKERAAHDKNMAFANQMIYNNAESYRIDTTKLGEKVAVQHALFLSEKEAKEMGLIENDRLRKIKQEVKIITKSQKKDTSAPIIDTFKVVNGDTIKTRNFSIDNEWYWIGGQVQPKTVLIDSIGCKSELVITTGYEKQKGLFKKSILVVEVKDKSPISNITGLYNTNVPPKKKPVIVKVLEVIVPAAGGFWLRSKFP